ncbi:MAG: single-stranded-DNA-specific exonuclease RecJ, partial [Planctomycetes bacterium]|nr:single-stranded-DNA-specific exonuclease RecJ [Planctomycetota bacterium]
MDDATPTRRACRWEVATTAPEADDLARRLRTGRLVAQLLLNRGIANDSAARTYLQPKLTDMHDPEQLGGVAQAADRVARAVRAGEPITLYGDYDVDGMTGTAILYRGLRLLGAKVDYYIPHRVDEGYGLNAGAIDTLADRGTSLIITIDCGITAVDCAQQAARRGLSMIITDHHSPAPALPTVEAIVHPTIDPSYPNGHLCGAGVALKLMWQVFRAHQGTRRVNEELKSFLLDATCMAALGTIADVVPLVGENRAIAMFGLRGLPTTRHPGLRSLIAAAGLTGQRVGAYDVGFMLAPRLNAAGRMGHAQDAADLLIRPEELENCAVAAAELTKLNTLRQTTERQIFAEAAERVVQLGMDRDDRPVIVLAAEGWHAGVIGIVAARLVQRFARPAVLIALDGRTGRGHGSARSIEGYHLAKALDACREHLAGCGGHAMAAGLQIQADHVEAFTEALTAHAAAAITPEMLQPSLRIDAEVTLGELSLPVAQQIEGMAPFGAGNPPVVLALRDAVLHAAPKRMGKRGDTLGLLLSDGRTRLRCVGFSMG